MDISSIAEAGVARKKTLLYGKNSIAERIREHPRSIRQIYIQDNFRDPQLLKMIQSEDIPCTTVSEKDLLAIKRADRLQGIVAETAAFTYTPFEELLGDSGAGQRSLIFLDSLNDPHNLGSIIRIAACFDGFGIVIPGHGSCGVNDTVIHVASGGENFVPVAQVTNLSQALQKAKKRGYWAVGTVVEGGQNMNRTSLPFPLCLVLGAEGKGIRYGIEKHLDLKVTLPMKGAQLSLNVAMACAIFANEIVRQRPHPPG
jgi:23S rRNA (guanosine2251-2'-O)-methyltransferase